jgi:hypothetical protein
MKIKKFNKDVNEICNEIRSTLKKKNKSYGNSALNPINVFSKGNAQDGLSARIDDKLSRIKNNKTNVYNENDVLDLIGYLILFQLSLREKE